MTRRTSVCTGRGWGFPLIGVEKRTAAAAAGYINRRAHLFLDTLRGSQGSRPAADSRTQGYFRGPSPQDVALRG
jgi:hypothetical protein